MEPEQPTPPPQSAFHNPQSAILHEILPESPVEFYLGREIDPATGETTDRPIFYESRNLTTHGVVVGMTGSGKTGLCLTILEEAALDGIPAILIDPKGDMANLLLTFPELRPEDFLPWVNADDARRKKLSTEDYAKQIAGEWKSGLADWKITGERIARLKQSAEFRVYTPGSEVGLPVSLVNNFDAPPKSLLAEDLRSKVTATTSALLGLAGVEGDAVRSKEHILISNILMHCWQKGENVPLAKLIGYIQNPPVRTLGVFDIDVLFPEPQRHQLAFAINNILASPTFQSWMVGDPLDFEKLLVGPDGKPRHLIYSIAHLGDDQRMFFVTLLLEQVIAWMRAQGGTTSLRALLYFDEVFGFMPPHPGNPPSKDPLLTILKQGRAFGLGALLATQNPVDLDYKALSNAGTWFVGKLQTERDKMRLLDGLEGACATQGSLQDRASLDKTISGLSTRKFLYHNIHEGRPKLLNTRWAMSYLRGPMSRDQISKLMEPFRTPVAIAPIPVAVPALLPPIVESPPNVPPPTEPIATAPPPDRDFKQQLRQESAATNPIGGSSPGSSAPVLGRDVAQFYLPVRKRLPAAFAELGIQGDKARLIYTAKVVAHGVVRFIDRKRAVDGKTEYLLAADPPGETASIDWNAANRLADAAWLAAAEDHGTPTAWFDIPGTVNEARDLKALLKDFERHLYDTAVLPVFVNAKLDLVGKPAEEQAAFVQRCVQAAIVKRDEEAAKQRPKLERRMDQIEEKIRKSRQQLGEKESEYAARRRTETVSFFETMLHMFVGRKTVRGISTASQKRAMSDRADLDVREAHGNLAAYEKDMDELKAEWEDIVGKLNDKWMEIANVVEEFRVTPRKADIAVPRFGLGWSPHWEIQLPTGTVTLIAAY